MAVPQAEGYDPQLFAQIAALEDKSFWFVERNRLILWALRRYADGLRDYLEVGCGTGYVLDAVRSEFAAARCVGVEPFEAALEIARGRLEGVELRRGDAASVADDASFDAVGSFDVLEHIPDDADALRAMARALRPGGVLVLTVPQHPWLWSDADERGEHVRRYRRRELVERVRAAGLEVVRRTSFVTTLLPALAAARALRRRRPPDDPLRELRMVPWAQSALRPAMALDRIAIRAGMSLPAGGSLLLVARRPQGPGQSSGRTSSAIE
jgi:SAM-dependent methyltransferase